ncbi:hypothetical protein Srufu_015560 [Streptomyces libani subsp. rufus]|nr:hypothetical protein Srufu_015560 [Streptomyces libani subsp. rufus]
MAQHSHDPYHPPSPVPPVDEKPVVRRLVPAALQHIAAMYAGGAALGPRRRAAHPVLISAGALTAVVRNLFFHPLGTRSSPRAAVLSAASSGSGTQIP